MLPYLKIKIVSLAAEAQLIRKEERKWDARRPHKAARTNIKRAHPKADEIFFGLKEHRIGIVRNEARWAQLAYAFLRGKSYKQVESGTEAYHTARWNSNRIAELAFKYRRGSPNENFASDLKSAQAKIVDWIEPKTSVSTEKTEASSTAVGSVFNKLKGVFTSA